MLEHELYIPNRTQVLLKRVPGGVVNWRRVLPKGYVMQRTPWSLVHRLKIVYSNFT
jgi:hypothetical protein